MRSVVAEEHESRAVELKNVLQLERLGDPFLVFRDGADRQRLIVLERSDDQLWIGRGSGCDVVLEWDDQVSRTHAELARMGGGWGIEDDGVSRNGTVVQGARVTGRRRLADKDVILIGNTSLTFRDPITPSMVATAPGHLRLPLATDLTPMQRKVLVALCRPVRDARAFAAPASNQAIADELFLSVDAVKTHLRSLFDKFGVEDLPRSEKRLRLAELAVTAGVAGDDATS